MNHLTDLFGEPISVYTTKQAVQDGILVKTGELMLACSCLVYFKSIL